jgi:hypothetical protein
MGKRDDKRREKMINEVFKDVDQIEIQTTMGTVKLISLEEIPITQMRDFMMAPGEMKMVAMADIIQMCLVNPEDWDKKLELMSVKDMNRLIKQWMRISGDLSMLQNEDGESGEFE